MTPKRILGIGNALVDVIVQIENDTLLQQFKLPKGGMEMIDSDTKREIHRTIEAMVKTIASGGSTCNTIHGLARLGAQTGYIGKVANDTMGDCFKNDLLRSNITPHLIDSQIDTGIATTFITPDAERTFATYLGAAATMTPDEIDGNIFKNYDLVHVEGYLIFNRELIEKVCALAKANGAQISMDMASYNLMETNRDFMMHLLEEYVDIIFGNEEEAKALTQRDEAGALDLIAQHCDVAVVKLGAEGAIANVYGKTLTIPTEKINCIDTNGMGDIYAAGFLYGLIHDFTPEKSGWIATKLATTLGQTIGAKLSDQQWTALKQEIFN